MIGLEFSHLKIIGTISIGSMNGVIFFFCFTVHSLHFDRMSSLLLDVESTDGKESVERRRKKKGRVD